MNPTYKSSIFAGTSQVDITPSLPVSLTGQYYRRLATEIHSPLTANILAVAWEGRHPDSMILVSCDLLGIPRRLVAEVRELVKLSDPSIDVSKIMLCATHIHTGPLVYREGFSETWGPDFSYKAFRGDEQDPEKYGEDIAEKIARGIVTAWQSRKPCLTATGYDHVAVSFNRRSVYSDGSAQMYGSTARPDFVRMEGSGDTGIHFLALYDLSEKLVSVVINLPCPAQVLEHHSFVSSDFWHEVRTLIHNAYGPDVCVLGLASAAGDLSPRDLVRMAREESLLHSTAMYNIEGVRIISKKVMRALSDFLESAVEKSGAFALSHTSKVLDLPLRTVTREETETAKAAYEELRAKHASIDDFTEYECMLLSIYRGCMQRWERQQTTTTFPIEVHCIRFGPSVILTNPFELYVEYADRMRAWSGCENTFVVQLCCGYEGYLPTRIAVKNGGYSSYVCNGFIGPDGGDALVKSTIELLSQTSPED